MQRLIVTKNISEIAAPAMGGVGLGAFVAEIARLTHPKMSLSYLLFERLPLKDWTQGVMDMNGTGPVAGHARIKKVHELPTMQSTKGTVLVVDDVVNFKSTTHRGLYEHFVLGKAREITLLAGGGELAPVEKGTRTPLHHVFTDETGANTSPPTTSSH